MNAFDVDAWIEVMHRRTRRLDAKSQTALMQLFDLTEQIAPVGQDNRREFWLKAKRGSLAEFCAHVEDELSEQEARAWMQSEYPEEECWYKFVSVHHNACRNGEFYGVFLNGKCVLTLNDPNEEGWPSDAIELIEWLVAGTKEVLEKLNAGTYSEEIQKTLPNRYKYGVISRRDYWDIYPEERADYRSVFSEEQIASFLSCKNELDAEVPQHCLPEMTARKFYEACAVCYQAIDTEPRYYFPFKDTELEHLNYNGITPKELYYMFADGRDDGLRNVPLDDAAAFADWKNKRGPHYEFNGSHPWEIVPSSSTEYSLHLYVSRSEAGYYFSLSGSAFHRSKDTIRSFLALRDAGFPIKLYEGTRMLARLEETDWIGIVPQGRSTDYVHQIMQYDILDAVQLFDGDKPELVAAKAVWQPETECRLL